MLNNGDNYWNRRSQPDKLLVIRNADWPCFRNLRCGASKVLPEGAVYVDAQLAALVRRVSQIFQGRRIAMSTFVADTPGYPVHIERPEHRQRTGSVNAFELIRQQAHEALNAIRARCRDDHDRILNRQSATER